MRRIRIVLMIALVACGGCSKESSKGRGDAGTDTDSDTDSDTETASDGDTDTDVDADGGSDAGTDSGTEGCEEGATTAGAAGSTWVKICGGTYEMGSVDWEDAQPVHEVNMPDFEMLQTEVTVAQYVECVDAAACSVPDTSENCAPDADGNWGATGREDHPLNCVDWYQAVAFCEWIGGRLPSESEWEYAARSGGQDFRYPWDAGGPSCERAVMQFPELEYGCGTGHTMSVCSMPAGNTEHGLCDMAGNAYEWVQDWGNSDYVGAPSDGSAWETGNTAYRTVRGGSWMSHDSYLLRTSYRARNEPSSWNTIIGARCVR